MSDFTFAQKLRVAPDTLINFVGEEAVLLDLKTERYFGLDEVGARMWAALTESESIEQAYAALVDEYEADPEVIRRDLTELIERLQAQGLVELRA
jgi:hypothetical protein